MRDRHDEHTMRRPVPPRQKLAVSAAAVLLAAVVAVVVVVSHGRHGPSGAPAPGRGSASEVTARIPAGDAAVLAAEVLTPAGTGPFPLVIMPSSWGQGASEYAHIAHRFTSAGYEVISYGQRGFGGSGGLIDFAGTRTREDVSTVITWALKHTRASSTRIAAVGISYGAGISLLAAAHDRRIRAVVAMSGWSDLLAALAPSRTPNLYALSSLLAAPQKAHKLVAPVNSLASSLQSPSVLGQLEALSASRSPDRSVAALNSNRPAIMLANAYADSILYPADMVTFFDTLTTPKRLQLAPGDHGGPEYDGLFGKPDRTVDDALKWVDHYVRGQPNGIDVTDPIQLQDVADGTWHAYRDLPARSTVTLAAPNQPDNVVTSGTVTWSRSVEAGTDTTAASGPLVFQAPSPYHPPTIALASLSPAHAFVWTGSPLTAPVLLTGRPELHVSVASSTGSGTLFAYLYDVDAAGSAALMTFAPYTFGRAGPVGVILGPTAWTLPAGHRLMLVVDTVDARYRSAAPAGSTLTLRSTAAAPATLSVSLAG
jgi:predicted acyl esterase